MKTLGILGGMGPMAGAYFYLRIVALTGATGDAGHLPVMVYGDPSVPDRTAHLTERGESPLPALRRGVMALEAAGAEVIAMPCNTAHAYLPGLAIDCRAEFLDMPRLAVEYAVSLGAGSIGLLATPGCLRAGVYQRVAKSLGAMCLTPDADDADRVAALIYREKAGSHVSPEEYLPYAESLFARGADLVVLGCTEISFAFSGRTYEHTLDPLELLARCAIRACGGTLKKEAELDLQRAVSR